MNVYVCCLLFVRYCGVSWGYLVECGGAMDGCEHVCALGAAAFGALLGWLLAARCGGGGGGTNWLAASFIRLAECAPRCICAPPPPPPPHWCRAARVGGGRALRFDWRVARRRRAREWKGRCRARKCEHAISTSVARALPREKGGVSIMRAPRDHNDASPLVPCAWKPQALNCGHDHARACAASMRRMLSRS